ncbi:hypothetical protein GA0061083_0191 [Pseudarthrobacter enclensis]|nr:hypothetical protein GA0061083_0191 [Pseudarthrobacter enclensis]
MSTLIRKLRELVSAARRRNSSTSFNGRLLEQHRDDVYVLMHQQLGGLR